MARVHYLRNFVPGEKLRTACGIECRPDLSTFSRMLNVVGNNPLDISFVEGENHARPGARRTGETIR